MMRTVEEIVERIKELDGNTEDYFGWQRNNLVDFLPYKQAKPYLKEGVTSDQWEFEPLTEDSVKDNMLGYMSFAWGKANNCRGLSSGRSIEHYKSWLWLIEDELGDELEAIYMFYGKTCLRIICERYNWDWKQWDDGEWRNNEGDTALPPQELKL